MKKSEMTSFSLWRLFVWSWGFWVLAVFSPQPLLGQSAAPLAKSTVGMPIRLEQVVIPGSELESIPLDDHSLPLVLRIEKIWPHGTDFRYDFSFYALEPGTHDLKQYLRRKDGSDMTTVSPLPVTIESLLPVDQFEPSDISTTPLPRQGGYRFWMKFFIVVWGAGLAAILWSMRRKKRTESSEGDSTPTLTLGARLEPLVKATAAGNITKGQQAELERLLLTYWNERLKLEAAKPAARIRQLKDHEEAGPLIVAMETWLHSPDPVDEASVQRVLEPYRSIQWNDSSSELGNERT